MTAFGAMSSGAAASNLSRSLGLYHSGWCGCGMGLAEHFPNSLRQPHTKADGHEPSSVFRSVDFTNHCGIHGLDIRGRTNKS
jgi:hypothetical protein